MRGSHALEPLHLPLPSSGWLMRILRSIIAPSATLVAFCDSKMTGRGGIRSQLICDELVWDKAIFLQQLAHQFKRCPFVSPGLDQNVEHFTFGIHGTPEVDQAAIDLEIDFVEMPDGMVSAGVCEDRQRSWVQNGSPSGAPSHRKPRSHAQPANPRRRGSSR